MRDDDLPLFAWKPPLKVIPFPAHLRVGHARKVAGQLAKSRTEREATHFLSKAVSAFCRQLSLAGVPDDEVQRQEVDYLRIIAREAARINATWQPCVGEIDGGAG